MKNKVEVEEVEKLQTENTRRRWRKQRTGRKNDSEQGRLKR